MKKILPIIKKLNKSQLYGILIIGVAVLFLSSKFTNVEKTEAETEQFDYKCYTENLEEGLARILNRVHGVTEAEVLITLESGFEYVPAYESEGDMGESEEQKKFIVLKKKGGSEEAFVLKEHFPKVQGVLVIAKGVGNSETERKVVEAVKTAYNISSNRVKVLEK